MAEELDLLGAGEHEQQVGRLGQAVHHDRRVQAVLGGEALALGPVEGAEKPGDDVLGGALVGAGPLARFNGREFPCGCRLDNRCSWLRSRCLRRG